MKARVEGVRAQNSNYKHHTEKDKLTAVLTGPTHTDIVGKFKDIFGSSEITLFCEIEEGKDNG